MKTKSKFNLMIIFLPLLAIILLASCAKEEISVVSESDIPIGMSLKDAEVPTPSDLVCDLIAGQYTNVGKVVYSDNEEELLVEYVATDGWMLKEVHFYVGNMVDFKDNCMNKKAVQIGKFPYSASDINDDTWSVSIPIPLDGIDPEEDGSYLVVAHAVVYNGDQEETAFANCAYQPIITAIKTRVNVPAWSSPIQEAYTVGDHFGDPDDWCYWLGTNIYENGDSYLINGAGWNYNYAEVTLTDDETNLHIALKANEGVNFIGIWAFVGTIAELESYNSSTMWPGQLCPDYHNFPHISGDINETEYDFIVPLPEAVESSISFEEAFGIKRWGWISYYNF